MDTESVIKSIAPIPKAAGKDFVVITRPDVGPWSARGSFGFMKGTGKKCSFLKRRRGIWA
jgi:hypothetical protein